VLPHEPELIHRLVAFFHLRQIATSTLYAVAIFTALFVIIYALEWRQGADRSRYTSRVFANDVAYALFYRGEIYAVFVFSAIASALEPRLRLLKFDLIQYLPPVVAYLCWWITFDFAGYWMHRWQHRSRFLWAFHSVHHCPERLTFLASYRLHVVEQLITNVVMYTPALVLGLPPRILLPVYLVQVFFEAIQHSELNWRFGRLYPMFVSPVFHSFHHSRERRHYDRNFGKILSVWDFVFGTAVAREPRPTRFGVEGLSIPESLVQQFLAPFRQLGWGPAAREIPSEPVPPLPRGEKASAP
jgi:sterol desaturase/sphingolipid hydroxylase (fatty acid hydroxylase superfamily)